MQTGTSRRGCSMTRSHALVAVSIGKTSGAEGQGSAVLRAPWSGTPFLDPGEPCGTYIFMYRCTSAGREAPSKTKSSTITFSVNLGLQ